jgi:hypothetical protein
MGKKVRRNSKSRNTKSRNNLRRSKVRRNKSTKKARKQRRGSRKQRGGTAAAGLTCYASDQTGQMESKLTESEMGEKKGEELIRVSILLTGLKKGTKITSQVRGRFKMADVASPQSSCDGFTIGYYDKKYSNLTLDEVIEEINIRNYDEPHNGCFLKIIGNPTEDQGKQTLNQLAQPLNQLAQPLLAEPTIIKVNTYLNPNSRYHLSQMYDPAKAQDLEEKFKQFTCDAELRIERVK